MRIGLCTFTRMGLIKMTLPKFNPKYYINVASKMKENNIYPRPRLKRTVIVNDNEWLPIVTVECEV